MGRVVLAVVAIGIVGIIPRPAFADDDDTNYNACMMHATTKADREQCEDLRGPPKEVRVQAKPPPRSASDWEVDTETVKAAPHQSGADVLDTVPGVFVSDRGLPGRAPHLSLRGFDGTSGQDAEIYAGNIPLNQVSHIRAPGYADMRLIMPEVVKTIRVSNGPYDPRQGDFAVAGSMKMDLGLEQPGFWAKGGVGTFGAKRVFLAFAPESKDMKETFAAFETDATDGPGGTRGGERSSFVAQLGGSEERVVFHVTIAIGTARFDFPGYLDQSYVEQHGYPYSSQQQPLGRDRTSQFLIGSDVVWSVGEGSLGLGAFAGKTKTSFHQNLTGFALDPLAGVAPTATDDSEQVNDAEMIGLTMMYRHGVTLTSKRDSVEFGAYARGDTIDQTDTRLNPDGTKNMMLVDALINATNVGAYADASLYPIRRVVIRGGPRLDSLSYSIKDRTGNAGLERTAQGFHLGNKATVDVAAAEGIHLVGSYGEGFRSPQARELQEGERVPFATVRSVEGGLRYKASKNFLASVVGFGSWLSHDRVFDASLRENAEAPSSSRAGGAAMTTVRSGMLGASLSATYTRAVFTGSNALFKEGDLVPYAPSFVVRDDAFVVERLGRIAGRRVIGRLGLGIEGVTGRSLPGGRDGKNVVFVDGLASLGWHDMELALNATNLLGVQYYDSQYVYSSNFEKSPTLPAPTPHVLVAPPTTVFITFQIHLRGDKSDYYAKQQLHDCLASARNDDDREDCNEQ